MRKTIKTMLNNKFIRASALNLLSHFPRFKFYARKMIIKVGLNNFSPRIEAADGIIKELSPLAERVYDQLKSAVEVKKN